MSPRGASGDPQHPARSKSAPCYQRAFLGTRAPFIVSRRESRVGKHHKDSTAVEISVMCASPPTEIALAAPR
jgi:hypothetical protein